MFAIIIDLDTKDINVYQQSEKDFKRAKVYFQFSSNTEIKKNGFRSSIHVASKAKEIIYPNLKLDTEAMLFAGDINLEGAVYDSNIFLNVIAYNKRESFEKTLELYIPLPQKPFEDAVWDGEIQQWVKSQEIKVDPSTIVVQPSEIR